jgi:3-(methylthio)propanoyl-CoA dehydrogenase
VQFGKPIRALPAVARILLNMKTELEAARALLGETGKWVDLLKAYEKAVAENSAPDMEAARKRLKIVQATAETLTPMVKYYSTEMGNRVCYQSIQVHGGVGYMREFNVERLFRDVRVTNIYEGTSQLQVVAAIGKLLGHSLDPLLDEWQSAEYPADMAAEKAALTELTTLYQKAVDHLKPQERDVIDYYACDLVDMAAWLTCAWLLMRDTRVLESKKPLTRAFLAMILPKVRAAGETVLATSSAPLTARAALL